jgi:sigma-B regulation protein RsbU (phosphoserine phosphatase)
LATFADDYDFEAPTVFCIGLVVEQLSPNMVRRILGGVDIVTPARAVISRGTTASRRCEYDRSIMNTIHISPADGPPFEYEVTTESIVVGRSTKCDLTIADRSMSRKHARFFKTRDAWMVEDLGSRNGTRVNGLPVSEPTRIRPGDVISVSASVITIGGAQSINHNAPMPSTPGTILRAASDLIAESEREFATPMDVTQSELQHASDQLRVLYDIHHALDASGTAEDLIDGVLERLFVHMRPRHGAVFLKNGDSLVRAASRSQEKDTDAFPESQSLAREVIGNGLVAVVHDTATDQRFSGSESLLDAGIRTLVAAPLLTPSGAIGMIVLSSTLASRQFTGADMELLAVVSSATGLRLRNLALAEEAAERRRFEQEVALARRIQVALLPAAMPKVRGFDIHGGNTPSRGVSGDYYQIVERADKNEVAVVIADVSGKGIAASLLTGYVDALVNAFLGEDMEPAEIFNRMSPQMNAKTPVESFATAFLGILSAETGALRFASAGHDPSILVRAGGDVELLMPTGMPLGLMSEATYTATETRLEHGDTLILYTDGITEAANPDEEMFERERLVEVCRDHRTEPPENLAASIHAAVDAFVAGRPYHDDRTLVILRRAE